MQQLFSLANKVIIITGATGVLGEAFVNAVADMDAKVVLIGRNENVGHERANRLLQQNKQAIFIKADVLNKEDLINAREVILKNFNSIDGLVNAAGGNVPEAVIRPGEDIFDIDMNAMHKAFELNLFGTMLPVSIFGNALQASGNASIVNISSMAAQTTLTKILGYSMAKAAIDNYTRWMSVEAANRYGESIRVNAIAPGFFITHQNKKLLTNDDGSYTERGAAVIRNTPFKRFGNPQELCGAIIWLLSDASKFVTGEVICIDGGFHINSGV
ncbi:MAG TPA: SDR family oxidoreductase [Parafilimonas sp.]|jgi:NAD(P)-dependent dehydrogenase (short-subunit alcohol dehydrogenase family)